MRSIESFAPIPAGLRRDADAFLAGLERLVGSPAPAPAPAAGGRPVYARNPEEIRDALSAIYGPITVEMVAEYLEAL